MARKLRLRLGLLPHPVRIYARIYARIHGCVRMLRLRRSPSETCSMRTCSMQSTGRLPMHCPLWPGMASHRTGRRWNRRELRLQPLRSQWLWLWRKWLRCMWLRCKWLRCKWLRCKWLAILAT